METKLKILTGNKPEMNIYCVIDIEISETDVMRILECNEEYFNLIKNGLIGVTTLKFQLIKDGIILVRTFSKKGHEAATYYVKKDNMLHLYDKVFPTGTIYSKNSLNVVEYEYGEDNDGRMIYRTLDDEDLDPVGDGFFLHDAISFVENNTYNYAYTEE